MFMRHQPVGHTLQPTAIVHEAFMKLAERDADDFEGEEHFFATAATVLRSVLVDHARRRRSKKRGGGKRNADVARTHIHASSDINPRRNTNSSKIPAPSDPTRSCTRRACDGNVAR